MSLCLWSLDISHGVIGDWSLVTVSLMIIRLSYGVIGWCHLCHWPLIAGSGVIVECHLCDWSSVIGHWSLVMVSLAIRPWLMFFFLVSLVCHWLWCHVSLVTGNVPLVGVIGGHYSSLSAHLLCVGVVGWCHWSLDVSLVGATGSVIRKLEKRQVQTHPMCGKDRN